MNEMLYSLVDSSVVLTGQTVADPRAETRRVME